MDRSCIIWKKSSQLAIKGHLKVKVVASVLLTTLCIPEVCLTISLEHEIDNVYNLWVPTGLSTAVSLANDWEYLGFDWEWSSQFRMCYSTMGNLKEFCNLIVHTNLTPLFVSINILKLHQICSKCPIVVQHNTKKR